MKIQNLFTLLLLIVMGCACSKKSNSVEEKTCGCNSPNLNSSVIEGREFEATISYVNEEKTLYYPNTFWITYGTNHFIVCNEDILPQVIKELKANSEKSFRIKCKGHTKKLCSQPISKATVTYNHIVITKIDLL